MILGASSPEIGKTGRISTAHEEEMGLSCSFRAMCAGIIAWLFAAASWGVAVAADWPTYLHDNARSGITAEQLTPPLHGQWVFVPTHPPQPAWPEPLKEFPRVRFDESFEVAVAGGAVYFGSSADDKVYSLDASTGKIRWSAFTGGPVRLAPALWKGRVLVGSDDGYAYCLAEDDGRVLWKVRAPPWRGSRKILGNGRMISLWPLRTGVLVDGDEGVAYFSAGVFPAEGIFVCGVKVEDGSLLWRNDTCGEHAPEHEFGGISPQGYLLASRTKLYVPSGRAMPAAFDRKDGRFLYYCSPGGKVGGTWALLTEEELVAGLDLNIAYDRETGKKVGTDRYAWFPGIRLIAAANSSYLLTHGEVTAIDRKRYPAVMKQRSAVLDTRERLSARVQDLRKKRDKAANDARREIDREIDELTGQMKALEDKRRKLEESLIRWRVPREEACSMILAGNVLFVGRQDVVIALQADTGKELWTGKINGKASGLAVSDGRLFVSTDSGAIHCFGEKRASGSVEVKAAIIRQPYPEDELTPLYAAAAESILERTGVRKGYCLVLGCGTGRLAYELARRTDLKIVGIEPDARKVETARRMLDAAGLYGSRVAVEQGSLAELPYSDYFANLIVSDELLVSGKPDGSAGEMFRVLRPCGGIACFGQPAGLPSGARSLDLEALRDWLRDSGSPEPEVSHREGIWAKITRGPLVGAGSWTHLYADPANTACSDDQLVRSPLGVVWFGDPGPEKMVERHARAAGPVSLNGRLFVQGENIVMACDAYSGFPLWEREIPGAVRVRADADGSNLAASDDGLFVAVGSGCLLLDAESGETLRTYNLPPTEEASPRRWGYVACVGKLLFGSSSGPLREYGELWRTMVGPDGTWARLPGDASPHARSIYTELVSRYARPDARAYADFQDFGAMWEPMARFPIWGDVRSPQGAVTPGMVTSDSIFALDTDTGKARWVHRGSKIAHPTITIGGGMVFFAESSISGEQKERALVEKRAQLDKLSGEDAAKLSREIENADVRLVVALDAATGEKRWEKVLDVTGCGGDRMGSAYHAAEGGILLLFGAFSNHDRGLFRSGTLRWRRVSALSASDGSVIWSREIGYLRRPAVMGDMLILEPWMCDIRTGELKTRIHPITGKQVPWEFIRGGHSCGITSACANCFLLRSYSTTYYDMIEDRGLLPFGAIRPGCWLNMIIANGLVLYPEASSGCRCSFPLVCSVALAPMKPTDENKAWSLFPRKGEQTPGDDSLTPVKHLAINFGAPGERKDSAGILWFAYPRPKLQNLQVDWVMPLAFKERLLPGMSYFSRNFRSVDIRGTDKPWLFASGCMGMVRCDVPLLGAGDNPSPYTIRLFFAAPAGDQPGRRVFDIKLQDRVVARDFDIIRSAGAPETAVVRDFKGVKVADKLSIELVPKLKSPADGSAPIINAIEIVREES